MKIRSYQALPALLANRFCKKCGERILGRGASAKFCRRCAQPSAPVLTRREVCEWCTVPIHKGRFCRSCNAAAVRKQRERLRTQLLERDGGICAYCADPLTLKTMTIDHFVPRVLGGTDDLSNLMSACITCNCRKGARHPDSLEPGFFVTKPESMAV